MARNTPHGQASWGSSPASPYLPPGISRHQPSESSFGFQQLLAPCWMTTPQLHAEVNAGWVASEQAASHFYSTYGARGRDERWIKLKAARIWDRRRPGGSKFGNEANSFAVVAGSTDFFLQDRVLH